MVFKIKTYILLVNKGALIY